MAKAKPLNPAAMTRQQLAELLTKAGGKKIHAAVITVDVADGAPTNADGTINLIQYAAWLAARSIEKT